MPDNKPILLIDVATSSYEMQGNEDGSTVADLLEEAGIDLSKSEEVTVRINGKRDPVEMDTVVKPGDMVLMTRNICNN